MSLEQEFDELKRQCEQLRKDVKHGITGARGAPGDISVAVTQASRAAGGGATEAARRVQLPYEAENARLRADFEKLRADFKRLEENIDHAVFCRTVDAMREY